jgi:hypothetical protein
MKKIKEKKWFTYVSDAVGVMAAIGSSALIGTILKGQDTSKIKGISKVLVPVGIFGLAHAAGQVAKNGAKECIEGYADLSDEVADAFRDLEAATEDDDFEEDDVNYSDDAVSVDE